MKQENYRPLPDNLIIKESKIEGLGLFSTEDINKGDYIGFTHFYSEGHPDNYIRTPLGGFINHSEDPNCELFDSKFRNKLKSLFLISKKDIKTGEELTLKYNLYNPEE